MTLEEQSKNDGGGGSVHGRRGGELHLEEPINWRCGGVRREQRDGDRWRDDRWRQRESKRWEVIKLSSRLTAEKSRNKQEKKRENTITVLSNKQCRVLLKWTIKLKIKERRLIMCIEIYHVLIPWYFDIVHTIYAVCCGRIMVILCYIDVCLFGFIFDILFLSDCIVFWLRTIWFKSLGSVRFI